MTNLSASSAAPALVPAAPSFGRLAVLFSVFYFIQGLVDPADGVLTQPVRNLLMEHPLDGQPRTVAEVSAFMALLALPWGIKPLYGLLTDFVPLAGYHRKSYLVLASGLSGIALLALGSLPREALHDRLLFWLLCVPSLGIAFADVVVDALMVEQGQPRGWTGPLQATQWTALYAAAALAGIAGGFLSEQDLAALGFRACGVACLVGCILALAAPDQRAGGSDRPRPPRLRQLWQAVRGSPLWATAIFLFLWSFNPFSSAVLHGHMKFELAYSEFFFGATVTVSALASLCGTVTYGLIRRRIPRRWLVHLAIVLGIVSTAAYWGVASERSALAVSAATGYTTAIATLIQLDLAAQVCPPAVAGTIFALLMSLSNVSLSLSNWLGGYGYEWLGDQLGKAAAFHVLVGIGALATATCWLVVPWLTAPTLPDAAVASKSGS